MNQSMSNVCLTQLSWRKQATFLRYDNYQTDTHLVRVILVLAH